ALHHLIVDSVSWRIIADDLHTIYDYLTLAKLNNNLESELLKQVVDILGCKNASYRKWVEKIAEYKNNYSDEVKYWEQIITEYGSVDGSLTNLVESDISHNFASFTLSNIYTQQLLQNANNAYHTQINDLLLTAFSYALFDLTGSKINYIVLEGHGRETLDGELDISRTLGWFTTMYPVGLKIKVNSEQGKSDEIGKNIRSVKETLRKIPNKGIGYGAIVGYKEQDLPKISFNYLGQFDKAKNSNLWNITGEDSGVSMHPDNLDPNIINVNGRVVNAKLTFNIVSKLDKATTNILAESFKRWLEEIIKHTTKLTRTYLTINDVDKIINTEYLDKIQQDREVDNVYMANSLQEGFIYHALNQGDMDDAYCVQLIWEYHHQLNVETLKFAWECALVKFPSLRLRFSYDEELVQVIDRTRYLDWQYLDLSGESVAVQQSRIKTLQAQDRSKAYDLRMGHLLRVYIIKQNNKLYTCIFSNHHAIVDGWSIQILLSYIHEIYIKQNNSLDKKPAIIKDRAYEETQLYLQQHKHDHENYWLTYLENLDEYTDLSGLFRTEKRSLKLNEYKYILNPQEQELKISDKLYHNIKQLGRAYGVTSNAIIHYVWHKILNIYANANSTIVGTTLSGRNLPIDDIESSVGLYINTLPLIVKHNATSNIIDTIKQVQLDINEANGRSNVSLAKLHKKTGRLFDSLFVFENYPIQEDVGELLNIKFIEAIEKHDYPLCVMVYEIQSKLVFKIKYAGELFTAETIAAILKQIEHLIIQIVQQVDAPTSQLQLIHAEQYEQIINKWNMTEKNYNNQKTIHELFEEQVARNPNHIAIKNDSIQVTYSELNIKANQLANYINEEYALKSDDLIALCLDRSEAMLIAILAVLKAGGAYVPIDPAYPDDRISYIVHDTKTKLMLSSEKYQVRLEQLEIQRLHILALDSEETHKKLKTQSNQNFAVPTTIDNLAYVIYTSGTTGNPKGVLIDHKNVVNYYENVKDKIFINDDCIVDFSTNIGFDLTVTTTLCSLCRGYTISIFEGNLQDLNDYQQHLLKNNVNIIKQVPSYFELLTDILVKSQINVVILGGEKVTGSLLERINKTDLIVYDEYGPTETTVGACLSEIYSGDKLLSSMNHIGKPYNNYKAYVLDANLNPLPVGAIGELYIGGDGLARGYLNQPELTAVRFIDNPFQSYEEKITNTYTKIYKTGDSVRWLPDGNLEYIGRNDFQVKIRGFRIELSEIEDALQKHGDISRAVVIARNKELSGGKELVAYIVADEFIPSATEIREFLEEKIPEYMIPDHYLILNKLPLTINGKLDRNALLAFEVTEKNNYEEPRNEVECKICQIWAEVLGLPVNTVGINDDFFRLGGDSILAIRVISKINKIFSSQVKVKDIFTLKTVKALGELLENHNNVNTIYHTYVPFSLVDVNKYKDKFDLSLIEDIYPVSYLQMGMLFESSLNDKGTYHTVTLYKVKFKYDEDKFLSVWNKLKDKHGLLRASFQLDNDGNYYTSVYKKTNLNYKYYKNVNLSEIIVQESKIDFDFGQAGLFRLIVSVQNNGFEFIFSAHHAIEDGWSVAILMNEFVQAYVYDKSILVNNDTNLSYGEFIQNEQLALESKENNDFWQNYLANAEFTNAKWKFKTADEEKDGLVACLFSLTSEETQLIHKVAKNNAVSVDSIFLYAYLKTISFFLNANDIIIGLVVNNRLEKTGGDELF
ncbi:MAG: amino acid adenylation domain-containing protein, partial [Gammaproteobacteria bacterium]